MRDTAHAQPAEYPRSGFFENVRLAHQRRMRDAFVEFIGNAEHASILEAKLIPHASHSAEGGLHDVLPRQRAQLSSCALTPADARPWRSNGTESSIDKDLFRRLPYEDASFDWVYCEGVIERIGNRDEQQALIRELWRVARKGIFVTTQNRKHPVDFGSGSRHLLDAPALEEMATGLPGAKDPAIGHVRYLGLKAHFFLMVSRSS
ncbi:MAG: methyltransferase domain-containing protein [Burkholderiaceae bacterium]